MYDEVEERGGSIANARWADPDYIVDRYPFEPGTIWVGRNPHCFEDAIGYADSRHVLVCAGSGSGKGRSFIVNNLAVWPGSTVTYDPKGDLPKILAARRGQGDDHCEGMEQDVFVLDPLGKTGLGADMLAYYDPLSSLDPNDGELPTWARRIAASLVQKSEGTESGEWVKRAERFIALVIMHVVTSPLYKDQRTLITVLSLIMEGEQTLFDRIAEKNPAAVEKMKNPFSLLIDEMCNNEACRGWIAKDARSIQRQFAKTPKFAESVRGEAADQLDWLKSEGIEIALTGKSGVERRLDEARAFNPAILKAATKGASVFIVMPQDDLKTYLPWVQCIMLGIFAAMRSDPKPPQSGHQTLMVIDEFLSLGYQDYVADAMDNIRSAGTKLVIIVQNFGKLKKLYGDEIDSFYSNCGLELYFGKIGDVAGDHLLKQLGEIEVVKTAQNTSSSKTTQTNRSTSTATGKTTSEGGSESDSLSINIGVTQSSSMTEGWQTNYSSGTSSSDSFNWSEGVNWSDSRNWGRSSGNTMGKNYSPHVFFEGLKHSNNYGTSLNRSRGGGKTRGGSRTKGGARTEGTNYSESSGTSGSQSQSEGRSQTEGQTRQTGKTWQTGESFTTTQTTGSSEGYQIGNGTAESFHKKPLLELHEMNAYFRDLDWKDRDHPAYPGLALVRISGEPPFFVRRSNYDQDAYFERCFTPDQTHKFLPLHEQPLLGYQYTPDHILEFFVPPKLVSAGFSGRGEQRRFNWLKAGDPLMTIEASGEATIYGTAPIGGRVMSVVEGQSETDGFVIALRADAILSEQDKLAYSNSVFGPKLEDMRRAEEQAARREEQRKRREEQERRKREQEELKRAQERKAEEERRKAQEQARKHEQERRRAEEAKRAKQREEGRSHWIGYARKRANLNLEIEAHNKFKKGDILTKLWMIITFESRGQNLSREVLRVHKERESDIRKKHGGKPSDVSLNPLKVYLE